MHSSSCWWARTHSASKPQRACAAVSAAHAALQGCGANAADDSPLRDVALAKSKGREDWRKRRKGKSGSPGWWRGALDDAGGWHSSAGGDGLHFEWQENTYGMAGRVSPYVDGYSETGYVPRQDSLRLEDLDRRRRAAAAAPAPSARRRPRPSSAHTSLERGWARQNVHADRVWRELEDMARLLHLPLGKPGQTLDEYVEHLRIAAQYGMAHYARTTNVPPPKHSVPISLGSLYSHSDPLKGASQRSSGQRPQSAGARRRHVPPRKAMWGSRHGEEMLELEAEDDDSRLGRCNPCVLSASA